MFIELNDFVAHVQADGPAGGGAVLLLHSLGTNLHLWDLQAAALSRAGHRVIRPDLRGHGLSEAPAGPYTMQLLARAALSLLAHLGVAQAQVCGVSIGGR
ncbi:MAG: alpha/beta fold hydrolase, partial [Acetobacteraceae bacterium]|nr:alpha/beta fold hydrolase [Acetobacteraceae bacterium]